MKKLLLLISLLQASVLCAQTFTGTGGAIPDNGSAATCYPVSVTGVGTINTTYGLASVCININHTWDADLEISLKAPDGTLVPLSIQNGGSGNNYVGTCFIGTATNSITSGSPPFSGNYLAQGTLGNVNNGQNADGTWNLCIQDVVSGISGTLSSFSITFSNTPALPLAPPANDDPCNAITLPVSGSCNYSTYSNLGATASTGVPAPGCASYSGGDVWFQVTVPANGTLNFDTQTGVILDGGMAIYSGTSCSALTLITCDDDGSTNGSMPYITRSGLTPGSTIWIRVWEYGNNNNGTFGICLTSPVPPPALTNDNPCTAIPITATTSCSYTTYTNSGATGTTGVPAPGCANYSGGDVWFSVSVPAGGALNFDTQTGTVTDGGMAIYSGASCNSLTLISCDDDGSNNGLMPQINATGLTPGSTVWVRFWEYGNDNNGTFGICVTIPVSIPTCSGNPPAGNTCTAATPVCDFNGYCGNTSSSYTDDYWPELFDAFDNCLGGGTTIDNNSFISFVASSTSASFNVWVTNSLYDYGIQLMFYEGGCGSGPVTCHGGYNDIIGGPNLITATGLTPGNTYYLMIDGVAGDVCDYVFDPVSGVQALNITPGSSTICSGSSIDFTASGGNGTYSWSPATGLNTTTGATVTATPTTTTTYTVSSTGTGACPVTLTKQVVVAVVPTPADPVTSPVSYCVGATAVPLTATGTNLLWYTSASGGTGSSVAPTPSTATPGTVTYYVSQTSGSCESSRIPITVTVSSKPAPPTVSTPVNLCFGATTSPLTASGSNLLWYTTASGGTGSNTAPTPNSGVTGNTTYYVSQSNGGCESNRTPIVVSVDTALTIYAHGTNPACANLCTGTAVVDITGGTSPYTFLWSNGATTQSITGLCVGTYSVTVTDAQGCTSSTTPNTVQGCFQIQSILVDACSATEYDQEMVFFQVGQNPLNTASTNINWPTAANTWNGYCTDAAFISSVNATITGGGIVLPLPVSGILPANANVVLITSTPPTSANSFANLTDTLYALFQCPGNTQGHFANTTGAAGPRTLIMNFGGGCTDTVTYYTEQLININGTYGGNAAANNGAYVNFSPTGTGTYLNYGCTIPYTIQAAQVIISAPLPDTPHFTPVIALCEGAIPPALPTSSIDAVPITGTWSPSTISTATTGITTYTFTPTAGLCATPATMNITVNSCGGNFGQFASAPFITKCSNNSDSYGFYNTTGSGVNLIGGLNYSGTNLGSYIQGSGTLTLNGGEVKTFKNPSSANVCGVRLFYAVYSGARPASPVFTPITLSFFSDCVAGNFNDFYGGPCSTGDQKWQNIAAGIDLTALSSGNYTLEVYYEIAGDNSSTSLCRDTIYENNSGGNYLSTFTITPPPTIVYAGNPFCNTSTTTITPTISGVSGGTFTATPAGLSINSITGAVTLSGSNSGNYTIKYVYPDANGCTDSINTTITIHPGTSSTTNISICQSQLPYSWNSNTYTGAGTFLDTLINANGCDSVVTLNLTILAATSSTTTTGICPNQLPFVWNSQNYTSSGTYNVLLTNAAGCDSTATLVLTVADTLIVRTDTSICEGASVQLSVSGGSGVYNWTASPADPTLTLPGIANPVVSPSTTTVYTVTSSTTITDNLVYNGDFSAGDVGFISDYPSVPNNINKLKRTYGIVTSPNLFENTFITCGDHTSGSGNMMTVDGSDINGGTDRVWCQNVPVVPGRSYSFGYWIHTINSSASNRAVIAVWINGVKLQTNTAPATSACGSWSHVTLTWNSGISSNAFICLIDENTSGAGNDFALDDIQLLSTTTCNFSKSVTVNVIPKTYSTANISVCPSQLPYNWNGNTLISGGSYTDTLLNNAGCDSILSLNLTVKATSSSTTNLSICPAQLPYSWNSNSYNAAGSYSVTLVNAAGCDSVATLNLTVKANSTSTTDVSVCPAMLPYSWNSNTYNAAGSYSVTLVNAAGCDSVATLNLTVKTNSTSTTDVSVCPAQLPYSWNSNSYNTAGSYSVTLVNAAGCDSVATLNLTVKANSTSTTDVSVCPAQLPYSWNSNTYNAAGTYSVTLVNAAGCDSVATLNLTVKSNSISTTNVSVCPAQLPYSWNSNSYNAAGTYSVTLVNAAGCDSVATLNLTVKANSTSTTDVSVCPAQLPYSWNSNSYNTAGSYSVTLVNAAGCDSAATLNLTVKANSTSTTDVSVCPAQLPYSWNSNSYNAAGTYSVTLVNAAGCDSMATLNLIVKANSSSTTNVSICPAQLPYSWNSNSYNAAGTYSVTLVNAAGCDSVATLNLTVKTNSTSTTDVSICPAQLPYSWNSNSYNTAGSYSVTLVNAAGCDSVATLNLTVKANSTSTTDVSVCPAQLPYSWNSNSYNAAGTYSVTLVNAAGCDSVATLNLTVKSNSTSTTNMSVCPAQLPYSWNSNSYNSAGTYTVTLVNAAGCDSVATLNLTVKTNSSSTTNVSVCPAQLPYSWNSNSYNAAGSYSVTLVNAAGCDSVATLNLTVKSNSTSTTNVSVCPAQLPYSWNSNSYNAAGTYSVTLVNAAGCDSVATLNLTVKANSTSTTDVSVCPAQLPYSWNSNSYNAAGTYSVTLVNAAGCDSVATLNLTVKANSTSTTDVSVCPAQLPYSWNSNSYNAAGTYSVTLVNAAGCDSVATLNLTVSSTSATTTNISICPAQLPYSWGGFTINTPGTYADTLIGTSGCDSVSTLILTLKANSTSTTDVSICPAQLPYSWNSNSYNAAGTYSVTLVNAAGCDSVATLNLTVKANSTSTTNVSVCPAQLPYAWNSNSYNAAGSYSVTLVNAAGCDSVATLNLTVKANSTSTTDVSVCPAQLPYSWNSNSYNAAGTYSVTLVNAAGCDSVATLNLTVKTNSSSTTNVSVCPAQLPYSWNSNSYNAAGSYSVTLVNAAGCDSVATLNLTVKSNSTSTTNVSVCPAQLPYSWNSNSYNAAGTYSVTLVNAAGCDSVATLNLTVKANSTSTTDVSICPAQLPYAWNNNTYNAAGSYSVTLVNAAGCDSVATLNLTVSSTSATTTNISICPTQLPYSWGGLTINAAGTYADTLIGTSGCDSISTLILSLKANSTSTTNVSVCPAQLPYAWNSNSYNAAGTYSVTLVNAAGCDSVATLNLTVKANSTSTTDVSVCPAQLPYSWNSNTYNAAGTYSVTLVNAAGCDSVATLNLTVKSNSTSTTNVSVCPAQLPYSWNSNSYNAAGTYSVTLVNAAGCDSVATLNLTVKANSTSTTDVSICPAQLPYSWNSNSYNSAGTYTVTLVNAAGCDSVATLNLTVKANSTSTTDVSVCPAQLPYSWNSNSYNSAGTYTVTLVNAAGCDSVATLNLTVKANSTSTTDVSVCPAQLPYSWNSNTYNAAGTYSVTLVNAAGCDSVATLNLAVNPTSTSSTSLTVCPAQLPYSWNNNTYNAAGTYSVTLVNAAGCDSVATLNLIVKANSTSTTDVSVCPAQLPYSWNSNSYNAAGSYSVTLVNAAGCDSVATLNLTVSSTSATTTNISICPTQLPYSWGGFTINTPGTYADTLIGTSGCDSVSTLILTLKANSTSTTNVSVCPAQLPYSWNSNSYNAAGTYSVTLVNAAGCDSMATLNLTVKTNSSSTTDVSVCPAQLPYSWNSNSYNAAGSYSVTLVNAAGCDSVATLNLTVSSTSATTTNISICPTQLPYSWGGLTINAAGTYADTLIGTSGCDSISTLILSLKANSSSTTNVSVCPAQLPYSWNSNSYNTAGTYSVTLVNAAGCDSVATLNLIVKANSTSTTDVSVCPAQLPYSWNSNSYNAAGSYSVTLVNAAGCDSVATLNLTVSSTSATTTNISICPTQLPYSWGGFTINAAGTYADTLIGTSGCDSISTLILSLKANSSSTTNVSVCPAQLPYSWNSNSYNAAGSYSVTLVNAAGCDSVATLNLTVSSTSATTTNISICPTQLPYSWGGLTINAAGTYADTLIGTSGCDSISTLILSLKANSSSTTNVSVCPAQLPYSWNSNSYNAAGTYSVTLVNAAGCDSVATLNLAVNPTSSSSTSLTVCPAQLPYLWNGNTYNTAGSYNVTLTNAAGCDSIATLILSVGAVSTSTTNISICINQLPYNWNGNNYISAGTYTANFISVSGCDSVATLNLTVNPISSSSTNVSVCPAQLPYAWNSNSYNAAGTYSVMLVNAAGCDSVATLNLTVKANSSSTTDVSVCPAQLPYSWNSNSYNAAGTYNVTLVNAAGCDSVATLNLTVKTNSTSTTNVSVCPAQLPYSWNSISYNAAGSYSVTLVNAAGCDSVATLNLTAKANSTSTTDVSVCPAQLPYSWNSNSYNAAGTYSVTLVNAAGCDSVATLNLIVKPNSTSTTDVSVCPAQLPYSWNSNSYNAAGIYSVTLVNAAGCDSVATLNLTVKSNSTSTTNVSVCPAQLPYSWNSNSYNAAGTYSVTLVNAAGCDSVATLNLAVNPTSSSSTSLTVCPAQLPYLWNGNTYNTAGSYIVTLTNAAGCDSIATLILTVGAVSTSTTNISICINQLPYSWNGNNYNSAGTYTANFISVSGCDSVATLNLTVNPISSSATNVSVCPAQLPYAWNSNSYNAAGTYSVTLVNAAGCDSVATLNLTVKANSSSTTDVSVCPAQLPYAWNSNSYNAAGTYSVTLVNAAGCDSVATLNLTVKANSTSTTDVSVCPSQLPYSWNSNSYNTSGSYSVTLVNAAGCDSVATLNLTVKANSTSTTNVSVCPTQLPYSWNSNSYNTAGTYTVTLVNAAGCDSVATLNLIVKPNSTSTTDVSVCPAQLPYSWNSNSYNAAGTYSVTLVNAAGCDSVATLNLTVKANSSSTTDVSVCPAQLPYAWNSNSYNAAGSYSVTLVNAAGCDSVATLNLIVKANSTSTTNVSVCPAQLPYSWNSNTYNAAGTYSVTLVNAAGCDSVATLNLTVKTNSSSTTNVSVCPAQLPYSWNGNSYNIAGTYSVTFVNAAGCDSVSTLILTLKANSTSTTQIAVCANQLPFSWNGHSYNAAGTYPVHLTNFSGCDSLATLILSVKSLTSSVTNKTICQSELPLSWNGHLFGAAGNYTVLLSNAAGCDSAAQLNLQVNPNPIVDLGPDSSLCPGEKLLLSPGTYPSYLWQDGSSGSTFLVSQSGIYSVQVQNNLGCKATASINIYFNRDCSDIFFPNAIAPNGINKSFGALGNLPGVSKFALYIYNRYGELVFSTNDPYQRWNGMYEGRIWANTNFVWYCEYVLNGRHKKKQKGNLLVIY